MSDIRINALATTATASASDDYVAIDGSANGTRKLSAYSPTFGGNLTASGNLTVSGGQALTIGSSANYSLWKDGTPTKAGRVILNNNVTNGLSLGLYDGSSWVDTLHIHPTNNNVLIGTATDSSNGKLQLATHTTSAGGIGFGTGMALYLTSTYDMSLDALAGNPILRFRNAGTEQFRLESSGSQAYFTASNNIIMRSAGVTALTLDASQNATFAGNVAIQSGNALRLNNPANSAYASLRLDASNIVQANYDWTFAGTIKPQQAATASAPSYVKGAIYFDTTLNKLRVGGATGWETITSV